MKGLPAVSPELIEYLEHICPEAAPDISALDRQIWFDAGRVSLVRHLRRLFEDQNTSILA